MSQPGMTDMSLIKSAQNAADGSVEAGVAALAEFEARFSAKLLGQYSAQLKGAPLVVLDGNLPQKVVNVSLLDASSVA